MSIVIDGISVLASRLWPVLTFLLGTLGAGTWLAHIFTRGHKNQHLLTLLLGIPLGLIPVALLYILLYYISQFFPTAILIGSLALLSVSVGLLMLWILLVKPRINGLSAWVQALTGAGGFVLLLTLRLAFLKDLLLPPYSDSPFHVQLVQAYFTPGSFSDGLSASGYYHTGFHALTAWQASFSKLDTLIAIPLVGQLLLALTPLGVFALLLTLTDKMHAAWFAALLTSFTWSMPAFAANWSKYPALAAVCLLPAVLTLFCLLRSKLEKYWVKILLAVFLAVGSALYHTRLLIVYVIIGCSVLLVYVAKRMLPKKGVTALCALTAATLLCLVAFDGDLGRLYVYSSFATILILLLALPFSVMRYPGLTLGVSIFGLLLLLARRIPLPQNLTVGAETLIDRPFAAILFFLPLAVLCAIGLNALSAWLSAHRMNSLVVFTTLVIIVLFGTLDTNAYKPDPCCNFTNPADLTALEWMNKNLPADATVYIASIEKGDGFSGSDAGVWITTVTGLRTELLRFDHVWFSSAGHVQACQFAPAYLYASGQTYSFQINTITRPDWYKPVYTHEHVVIYQIIGCSDI
ncbi:MAG: hypothetical protein FD147_2380 [Chloroflexi bacterium]|nr:MAG: hypothetical protein FD147_2380 [Chloroflexota bacterium]